MNVVSVRCTSRYRGYSEQEINKLKTDLESIASMQLRPQGYPEAGGVFEMTVVAQFVGTTILGGLLWDGLKRLGKGFYELYQQKKALGDDFSPEIDVFEFRFDDLDIRLRGRDIEHGMECNFLSEHAFHYLPELIENISFHH